MSNVIDHLVIGAHTLEQGLSYVQENLGIHMPPGGKHPFMGTHNHLMKIGEGIFLEIIAIDPEAPAPKRPRWFALDDPRQQTKLKDQPQLMAWVLGTPDIVHTLGHSSLDLGQATEMTRGDLHWLISIRADGALLEEGLMPIVIQWPEGPHPSSRMKDLGLKLSEIRLYHPHPEEMQDHLQTIQADHLVSLCVGNKKRIEADFQNQAGNMLSLR